MRKDQLGIGDEPHAAFHGLEDGIEIADSLGGRSTAWRIERGPSAPGGARCVLKSTFWKIIVKGRARPKLAAGAPSEKAFLKI